MKRKLIVLSVMVLVLGFWAQAQATLFDGQTVDYQYYYPDLSTHYSGADDIGNKVVGPGIEVTDIVEAAGTLDISDVNLLINFTRIGFFSPGAFNGFEITDVLGTIPDFTSVLINSATTMAGFDSSGITFDADHIWVNWQNLAFSTGAIVSLDVTGSSAVPEPSTILLLASGLVGLAGVRKRFKQ